LLGQLMDAEIIKHEGDQIRITFLDLQMADLDRLSQRRSEAGRRGGESKSQASAKQNEADKIRLDEIRREEIEDKKEKKNTCVLFDSFWSAYPRKTSKQTASKAFDKLSDENQQKAIDNIARLYANTEVQFVPHAATYLNQARWEDEAIVRTNTFARPLLNQSEDADLPRYR